MTKSCQQFHSHQHHPHGEDYEILFHHRHQDNVPIVEGDVCWEDNLLPNGILVLVVVLALGSFQSNHPNDKYSTSNNSNNNESEKRVALPFHLRQRRVLRQPMVP